MPRALALFGCVALAGGCLAAPGSAARAITSGQPDPGDGAVAALIGPRGEVLCSGTLISPNVVLTAAHCVFLDGPAAISFDAALADAGAATPLSWQPHPAFAPATLANDIGLVLLAHDVSIAPARLLALPFDAARVDTTVRVAGFGAIAAGDSSPGARRSGTATVASVAATTFDVRPTPSQPCSGDSGGPAFVSDSDGDFLAGVTSDGDAACSAFATFTRVDAFQADFIAPYVEAHRPRGCSIGPRAGAPWPTMLLLAIFIFRRRRRAAT